MENNKKMGLTRVIDDMQGKIDELFNLDAETWTHTMALEKIALDTEKILNTTDKRLRALEKAAGKRRGRKLVGTLALVGLGGIALGAWNSHCEKLEKEKAEKEKEIADLKEQIAYLRSIAETMKMKDEMAG